MHLIKGSGPTRWLLDKGAWRALLPALLLIGCTSSNDSKPSSNEVDVYVAGYESNGSSNVAKYWKNGTPTFLSSPTVPGTATTIFSTGSDLYVAGREFDGNSIGPVAKVWKSSKTTSLTDGTTEATANSIWVSGSDVYIAGGEAAYAPNVGGGAEYWKNGNKVMLTDGMHSAMGRAITVSGTDVYVAGEEIQYVQTSPTTGRIASIAKIWKNGVAVNLTDSNSLDAGATSIVVSGLDVYAAGWEFENSGNLVRASARLWKNGQSILLSNNEGSIANALAISGTDIFVAGTKDSGGASRAVYWKNGQLVQLGSGSVPSTATSVVVVGSDVYVAGSEGNVAKYWMNGISNNLTDGRYPASANSIFVRYRR